MTNPQKLTESGLARKLGVSRQAIHELVQRGILKKDDEGLINVDEAESRLLERLQASAKTTANIEIKDKPAPLPADQPDENIETTNFHIFRTIVEANKAKTGTIELAILERNSFPRNEIEQSIGTALAQLRERLLQIPARLGATLSAEQQNTIHAEIHAALTSMEQSSENLFDSKQSPNQKIQPAE